MFQESWGASRRSFFDRETWQEIWGISEVENRAGIPLVLYNTFSVLAYLAEMPRHSVRGLGFVSFPGPPLKGIAKAGLSC